MANGEDVVQRRVLELLNARMDNMGGEIDPVTRRISELMLNRGMVEGAPPEDGPGFFSRAIDALTPTSREEFGLIGAGILAPTIRAGQSIFQIPGLVTSKYLPTDKAADFLGRLADGVTSRAEAAALGAGASPELVADSHLLGEIIGFTIPVVASLKAARLVTGIQGPITTLQRNFVLDSTAGAIFGAALVPGEEIQERFVNTLRESALFGVGGLMLNGLIFAATGMRYGRARALGGEADLDEILRRIANGEEVILNEGGIPLARLLSEEGFLASSPEAYSMLGRFEIEEALVQAAKGALEAGLTRSSVRSVGSDFVQVNAVVDRLRPLHPGTKFDILKGEVGYDIHFGQVGLSNLQKAQIAREGRYAGQMLQKGDATYEFVRKGKGDRLVVRTAEGKTTTIRDENITDLAGGIEALTLPSAGQAMYADLREYAFARIRASAGVEGGRTETIIVQGLRDGTIDLSQRNLRLFEVGGAITHPTEVGINPLTGSRFVVQATGESQDFLGYAVLDNQGQNVGGAIVRMQGDVLLIDDLRAVAGPDAFGTGSMRDIARQIIKDLRAQGANPRIIQAKRISGADPDRMVQIEVDRLMRGEPSPEGFARGFLAEGTQAGALLSPSPVRHMDDVLEAWLKERGLNLGAEDIEAFRANFGRRLRDDIWAMVPEEDLALMQSLRDDTLKALDDNGLPFTAQAHAKGFHVERLEAGRVALRDINTGARLEFGSETFAQAALRQIVRSEKDPMFDFITPGAHGVPGLTGGYPRHEGIFTMDGSNIAAAEFVDHLPIESITNRRDYLRRVEDMIGVPVFSRGFAEIDLAMLKMRQALEPIHNRIARAWKGLNRAQRVQTAEFWGTIEGSALKGNELIRAARAAGLNSKQIAALTQSRTLFDFGAQLLGLPESRFIPNYYSRIRPAAERGEKLNLRQMLSDDPVAMKEYQFWAEMPRTGDMSAIELDPEIVLHRYFRGLMYKQEISPLEQRVRGMVDQRIKDLSPAQQQAAMKRAIPGTTPDSYVLPVPVRGVLTEYLNNIRGDANPKFLSMRRYTSRLFQKLGMETDGRLFDELHSTYLSLQYGAAIGLRFSLANRNAVQNLWMMYPRVGGKYGTESLRKAMTQAGYDDAARAGAVRPVEASVPLGDAVFESWVGDPAIMRGFNPVSQAFASTMRMMLRTGQMSRKVAQKFLIPYGSGDQVNRAWAFHWQRMHTADVLQQFHSGKISWETFLDDGLPFFSQSIKKEFRYQFDKHGESAALDWIGKQGADEAHFLYGSASTPSWMQSPFGRLLGVFGQWPLWALEMYKRRMAEGTPRQIGAFWARTVGLMGAFANMTAHSGIDMWNWMAPASLEYAGGPLTDVLVQTRAVVEGSVDQKAAALKNLGNSVTSLILPGQIFYQEIGQALDETSPHEAALRMTLGRAVDKGNYAYDYIYNPSLPMPEEPPVSLEGLLQVDLSSIGRR